MKISLSIAASLALSLASIGAKAQGWIAGGAVGQAKQQDYSVGGPITTRDDTDTAYRLFGGFMTSDRHGVVASYIDLGETRYDGPAFGGFEDRLEADGIDVSYLISWAPGEQERISLFGTIGVFVWDQDVLYTDSTGDFLYRDEGTSFSFGVGTNINFDAGGTSRWSVHAEWQVLKDVGDARNSGHDEDRDIFTLGLSYRFGAN
jgi:hypothetical protein